MVDRITGPIEIVNATLSGANTYLPSGAVTNTAFSTNSADRLAATKANHQKTIVWEGASAAGTTVVAKSSILHIAQGAGTIVSAYIRNETAPTGGDLDYTVDILKSTNGTTSFATILSSPIASPADGTVGAGTLSTTTYSQYDAFKFTVATSGSTGTQAIDLTICLVLNEEPS